MQTKTSQKKSVFLKELISLCKQTQEPALQKISENTIALMFARKEKPAKMQSNITPTNNSNLYFLIYILQLLNTYKYVYYLSSMKNILMNKKLIIKVNKINIFLGLIS